MIDWANLEDTNFSQTTSLFTCDFSVGLPTVILWVEIDCSCTLWEGPKLGSGLLFLVLRSGVSRILVVLKLWRYFYQIRVIS